MLVFLDMDGVIVNWDEGVCKLFSNYYEWKPEHKSICDALNITKSQLWSKVRSTKGFWENLQPYPWLDELLDVLNDYEVHICTSPGICDAETFHGKATWINKYLGSKFNKNFVLTPNKWMLAKPDRILIDDYDKQITPFKEAGGHTILFPQEWNSNSHNSHRKIEYVKEKLEEIKNDI